MNGIYNVFKEDCWTKTIDLVNDTIKVALLDNNHIFTATDSVWSDVSVNEISGAGYTSGGATLTTKTVTLGTSTLWDADDISWVNATFIAYHAVIYDVTNSNSLICSIEFAGPYPVDSETFKLLWDAVNNAILILTTGA